jgi:hypothetical protein
MLYKFIASDHLCIATEEDVSLLDYRSQYVLLCMHCSKKEYASLYTASEGCMC